MLRLDPGEGRIRTARSFRAWEGGGEYNVARGLRRASACGRRSSPRSRTTRSAGSSRTSSCRAASTPRFIRWVPYDGVGRDVRNGLNFTERGFGVRGAVGVSRPRPHRGLAAEARATSTGTHLFGELGRALVPHRRHLRRALRERGRDRSIEAVTAAKQARHDRLLRPQLPAEPVEGDRRPGHARRRSTASIAPHVDVMIGNEEDFTACLGFEVEGVDENLSRPRARRVRGDDRDARPTAYPNFQVIAHDAAHRAHRDGQRLGRDRLVARDGVRQRHAPRAPGDPRPRRRRRLVRLRA